MAKNKLKKLSQKRVKKLDLKKLSNWLITMMVVEAKKLNKI